MTLTDIKNNLTALKPELHERFGVSEIGVFGSRVRGDRQIARVETAIKQILEDYNLED